MNIRIKRAYETVSNSDGTRVLVDHIWPRGIKKEDLKLDAWVKDLAPTKELRIWFGHDPEKWNEFKDRYFRELEEKEESLQRLLQLSSKRKTLTLVYAAKDTEHNNAAAFRDYLNSRVTV